MSNTAADWYARNHITSKHEDELVTLVIIDDQDRTNSITTWNRQREDYLSQQARSYLEMMSK